jgi:acyl-CoA synthetase (AMP-forming)/AMP-acid ligase II
MAEAGRAARNEPARTEADIARVIREALAFGPDEIILLPRGALPKTTSGKMRHGEARRQYLAAR